MHIHFEQVTHVYGEKTPFERTAINDVDVTIQSGSYVSIIGHTGSGKSTLIQHINGLLKPSKGKIKLNSMEINKSTKEKELYQVRKNIGFLFQQPEHQLFEETVEKELLYAVINYGLSLEDAKQAIPQVLDLLQMPLEVLEKSPYELSGGQKKRIALACLLLLKPTVYVLDEPLAGLDPDGQKLFLNVFNQLHKDGSTIIMITHNIEQALECAKDVLVMKNGAVHFFGSKESLIEQPNLLLEANLEIPYFMKLREKFCEVLHKEIPIFYSLDDAIVWYSNAYEQAQKKEKSNA